MAKASRLFWMAGIVVTVFHSTAKAACPAAPVGSNQDRVIQMVAGGDGFVQMGSDAEVDATEEGAIVYDAANNTLAVCDGTNWVALGAGGGGMPACSAVGDTPVWDGSAWACRSETPPLGCPNIGNTCDDGSIFAGDTNMYVTDANQSPGIRWSNQNAHNNGARSNSDGAANQAWIVANRTLSEYPAFELCENLFRHGWGDWYLPSYNELNLLYTNRSRIGGFAANNYWSSTERGSTDAWRQSFGNGSRSANRKTTEGVGVRCVRRH